MTTSPFNSRSINDFSRCQHRTASGKRCRLRVTDTRAGLCFRHASKAIGLPDDANLRHALADDVSEFRSANDLNEFLSRLLLLLSENRISPRRAAVLAYIANLLLRTIPIMHSELNPDADNEPIIHVDFGDLPRPNRESPADLGSLQSTPPQLEPSRS